MNVAVGLFCLAALWCAALLVAGAAIQDLRALVVARARSRRRIAETACFVAAELVVCAGCTALALWPPVFGRLSTLGAVSCLAFFLGVTPLGVWISDRAFAHDRAILHDNQRVR